jgi:hypothetical protein
MLYYLVEIGNHLLKVGKKQLKGFTVRKSKRILRTENATRALVIRQRYRADGKRKKRRLIPSWTRIKILPETTEFWCTYS